MQILPLKRKEEQLLKELSWLSQSPHLLVDHLIEIGKSAPPFDPLQEKEEHLIQGCLSKAWLIAEKKGPHLVFQGNADALLTQGLLQLLINLFSYTAPQEILTHPLQLPSRLGLDTILGVQRRSGLAYILQAFRNHAKNHLNLLEKKRT